MEKFNFEAFSNIIKDVTVKTASALRELLAQKDVPSGGCLTARERLERLFDAGTFSEIGAYVRRRRSEFDGTDEYDFESVICGWGAVNGRLVYAFAQDTARSAGSVSEAHARKICETYRLAMENGAPIVGIFDSAGAVIPEGVRVLAGYGKIMKAASAASGVIPQIAVASGYVAGAAAVICGMFDLVIKTEDASLSVNPPFNTNTNGKADLGVTAISAVDGADAVGKVRDILNYFPSNNFEGTPEGISNDSLNRPVSLDAYESAHDAHELISAFADNAKFIELYSNYAPEIIGGVASVGGTSVGIVATNKAADGGVITAAGARKASRLVSLFDSFNIPVITLVDSVGFDSSISSETSPFASELAKLASAYAAASSSMITVIVGEAYGSTFTVLGSKALGADVVLALDTAKIAAMNASSAVAFMMNDQITSDVSRKDLERQWDESIATPVEAASSGEIDDIIASAELRARIGAAVYMLTSKSQTPASRKHLTMPL